MTGRLRKLYGVVGMIAFLLLSLAVLIASFRAAPVADQGDERSGVQASAPNLSTVVVNDQVQV